ncbi:MAG: hypothetical protein H0V69_03435, partial [Acidimicrobiia bacterium]|nr:hypothetical protein [Acidimicrobiia bacterium]MDQ3391844.1 hypothetical protein [Actinomycetota bacterium]
VEVCDSAGAPIFRIDTDGLGTPLGRIEGRRTLRVDISNVELLDGEFPLNLSLSDRSTGRIFDWREGSDSFEVANPTKATGLVAFDVTVKEQ